MNFKKSFLILVILLSTLSFVGCTKPNEETGPKNSWNDIIFILRENNINYDDAKEYFLESEYDGNIDWVPIKVINAGLDYHNEELYIFEFETASDRKNFYNHLINSYGSDENFYKNDYEAIEDDIILYLISDEADINYKELFDFK